MPVEPLAAAFRSILYTFITSIRLAVGWFLVGGHLCGLAVVRWLGVALCIVILLSVAVVLRLRGRVLFAGNCSFLELLQVVEQLLLLWEWPRAQHLDDVGQRDRLLLEESLGQSEK